MVVEEPKSTVHICYKSEIVPSDESSKSMMVIIGFFRFSVVCFVPMESVLAVLFSADRFLADHPYFMLARVNRVFSE